MMQRPGTKDIDLAAARTFIDVVEADGISAAARRLGLAKSVVSDRVTALEASLDVSLLGRTNRLVLTERGRIFYEGLKDALGRVDRVVHAAVAPDDVFSGTLRIGAPSGLGIAHLGTMIARFLADHPGRPDRRSALLGEWMIAAPDARFKFELARLSP